MSETSYFGSAMSTLTDQLLERLSNGSTLARANLALDANYDSVGRALGDLVKERKIVRVGRGRYRIAAGNAIESPASIGDRIVRRINRSKRNVFLRRDFGEFGSYDAVGRALRQATKAGKLVQIGYGLYAKAALSPFSGKPAPVVGIKRLAVEALGRLGKSVDPSSFDLAYTSGRSTQVPTGRTLAVKDRVTRRIGYDGNYVVFERT
jgi:hypothetical protein